MKLIRAHTHAEQKNNREELESTKAPLMRKAMKIYWIFPLVLLLLLEYCLILCNIGIFFMFVFSFMATTCMLFYCHSLLGCWIEGMSVSALFIAFFLLFFFHFSWGIFSFFFEEEMDEEMASWLDLLLNGELNLKYLS